MADLSRRAFLKGMLGVAGATAAGVLLPDAETTRRFWRGWRPEPARAGVPVHPPVNRIGDAFSDATYLTYLLHTYDVVLVDREIMWFDGDRLRRTGHYTPAPASNAPIEIIGVAMPELSSTVLPPVRVRRG